MRVRTAAIRRALGACCAAALIGAATTVLTAPGVGAGVGPLVPTTTADDGSVGSLRDILENQVTEGDTVELEPGATYELTRCDRVTSSEAGAAAVGDGDIEIADSVLILGNGATIEQTCLGFRVLFTNYSLSLNGVTITGGTARGGGGGVRLNSNGHGLTLVDASIVGNCSIGSGGGIKMNADGDVKVGNSTIANNTAYYGGGGISHSHDGDITLVNSTVSGNAASWAGGVEVRNGFLDTVYSDIVSNEIFEGADCGLNGFEDADVEEEAPRAAAEGDPANVDAEGIRSFGTVIAQPVNGDNCSMQGTTSSGYNFADDETCDFLEPTDTQGDGLDPMLGALAANGGPTLTHLPQAGSALIDAIPDAACNGGQSIIGTLIVDDQRALPRPSPDGGACDIGSVEVQATPPAVIQPTFTG